MSLLTGFNTSDTNKQQESVKTMATHTKADKEFSLKVEAVRALELSNRLHSTLDLDELFSIYQQETQRHVTYDSISYSHPEDLYAFEHGQKKRHTCKYRLLIGGQNLGELEFTRAKRFSEAETITMEYTLSSLLNPLHNGLMYYQAIAHSMIDPLTGVKNRSTFDSSINREISLAQRHGNPFALIVLDIDHFKGINDQYGHLFGDCVLRDVAQTITKQVRDSDMVFRYGGEEFVILLSNTCEQGAQQLAERIRKAIAGQTCSYNGNSTRITASQGVACLYEDDQAADLFSRADKALYSAKENGRNCTVLAK